MSPEPYVTDGNGHSVPLRVLLEQALSMARSKFEADRLADRELYDFKLDALEKLFDEKLIGRDMALKLQAEKNDGIVEDGMERIEELEGWQKIATGGAKTINWVLTVGLTGIGLIVGYFFNHFTT